MTDILDQLETIIWDRRRNPIEGSYTNSLLDMGRGKIAQKVGEEAVEVLVAALSQDRQAQIGELADLCYHLLVLMADLDITLEDLRLELRERHQPRP